MTHANNDQSLEKIAVTALNTAWLMTNTDIDLYPEIDAIARRMWSEDGHAVQPQYIEPEVNAPAIELRYRAAGNVINSWIDQGNTQVMDIAAGFTPRGLTMTAEHPDLTYVEADMPVVINLLELVIGELSTQGVVSQPDNLHLESTNALIPSQVLRAAHHFDPDKPVLVTTEGLLHYLAHDLDRQNSPADEKAQVARSITGILRRHGGVWYTDMPVQRGISGADSAVARITTEQTGRSIRERRFANNSEAQAYFARLGLIAEPVVSYIEPSLLRSLTSPAAVGANLQQIETNNRPWYLWAIRLAE